ncbi:MAG: hypothetical protein OEW19_13280 [Acidobacteriota bacterium]|nr:hypothetical protein [Acidobacteriota bacterium]
MRARLALLLLAFSAAVPAQQLGTLFLSPEERDALDRQRRGEAAEPAGQAVVERRLPVITGYVKRSDGKSTVFLDKQPFPARDARIQGRLNPRIVERYEPLPPPPPLADPPTESTKSAEKPAAEPKGTREE